MPEIDLKELSELISRKLARGVDLTGVEKIGSGYHSDGFKLTAADGSSFFLKHLKSHDLGFEFPERKAMTLMVSDGMGKRAGDGNPRALGVITHSGSSGVFLPELSEESELYHLQEFGGVGTSYSQILEHNANKEAVDDADRQQLGAIAGALVKIHATKHPVTDRKRLDAVYNDGLRSMLTHPELSIMVLSEFPADYSILDLEGQKEVIGLMYENIRAWMGRGDRMTALHGDFWGANIFFREDGSLFIIDFSRIPWGDPAIDAGWFIAQLLWKYHETQNPYFRELTEAWLSIYQEKSGDTELRKALPLVIGWTGIVQIYPRWFPSLDVDVGKRFIRHIKTILRTKEFVWSD